jgi:DNA-binding winged helix-turn-helix (wHTH) protein
MNVLVIRANDIQICSSDGRQQLLSDQPSSDDVTSAIETVRPAGVVFLGVRSPNPIDSLCRLRTRGCYEAGKAAIIRSESELRTAQVAKESRATLAFHRFRGLFRDNASSQQRDGRKFLVDLRAREITINGKSMSLSPMEFRLLVFFLRYPGVVFSREELLDRICGDMSSVDPHIIDVMVRRIRMKIELDFHSPDVLRNVRGLGYIFTDTFDSFYDRITGSQFVAWPCGGAVS